MIIILRRIPESTRKTDIINFIEPVLKGRVFQKTGHIVDINIQTLLDTQTKEIEHHGLVTIDSDEVGNRIIKKLNRKIFNDKRIGIREYIYRSWRNDPRIDMENLNGGGLGNKRQGNRRRSKLEEIRGYAIKFTSEKSFHRSL